MYALELQQRLLIPNYKKLVETLSQIIDDPNQDRFVLNHTRELLVTRISAIEAAIAWRLSFELPPANALSLELGPGTGSLTTDHVAPTIPSIPGPSTASPSKKDIRFVTSQQSSSYMHAPPPTTSRTLSRERMYPRLPKRGVELPSSRRPLSGAAGEKKPVSRESSCFALGQSAAAITTDLESFDQESDDSDIVATRATKSSKAPPLTALSSFDSIEDINVTTRSPRKRRGMNGLSASSPRSISETNFDEEPTVTNVLAIPSANVASGSSHLTQPIHTEIQQELFNNPGSKINTPINNAHPFTEVKPWTN
ncbi:hypothetical protein RSAG8_12399, partial [Rhizoctonia solani AG-8 WAC10335]